MGGSVHNSRSVEAPTTASVNYRAVSVKSVEVQLSVNQGITKAKGRARKIQKSKSKKEDEREMRRKEGLAKAESEKAQKRGEEHLN